jgi:hypothetical protein
VRVKCKYVDVSSGEKMSSLNNVSVIICQSLYATLFSFSVLCVELRDILTIYDDSLFIYTSVMLDVFVF